MVQEKICCIYFMFLHGSLVYIGQTKDLRKRIEDHNYSFQYDTLRWIECPATKLKEYEKRLIKILKPSWNDHHNTANPLRSLDTISFKTPPWIYHLRQIGRLNNELKFNPRCDRREITHKISVHQVEYDYLYRRYGFRNSVLDDKYFKSFLKL
jgi:hypothetical protein